jgi:hypothetical protein
MLNKRGSVLIYGMMVALTVLILALALAPAVAQFTNNAMNASDGDTIGMDCNNISISNFQKAACYATDLNLFYFIGGLIFLAGAFITARVVFS